MAVSSVSPLRVVEVEDVVMRCAKDWVSLIHSRKREPVKNSPNQDPLPQRTRSYIFDTPGERTKTNNVPEVELGIGKQGSITCTKDFRVQIESAEVCIMPTYSNE